MCAKTAADCPTCGDSLYYVPGRRAECINGHTAAVDALPVPAGRDLVTQYHAAGRSLLMIRTLCDNCRPL